VRKNGKKKSKPRPKYGLGFIPSDSSESEDDERHDPRRVMCRMMSVISSQSDVEEPISDEEDGNP
jgi:hypothetical protein